MKVINMTSSRGNEVPNQFVIYDVVLTAYSGERKLKLDTYSVFQSYGSIIAAKTDEGIYLDETCWEYSGTTGKYRNDFLDEDVAETRAKIASGEYKLVNLNK